MNASFKFTGVQFAGLKTLKKVFPKAVEKGLAEGADTLLDWMNEGSPKESRTPPLFYGNLIESSSVFVGSKLVGVGAPVKGAALNKGRLRPDPLKSYNGKDYVITVVYNTSYASKMHEWLGGWGQYTQAKPDAGNKWIEKHLQKDGDDLMKVIGKRIKKEVGL